MAIAEDYPAVTPEELDSEHKEYAMPFFKFRGEKLVDNVKLKLPTMGR